MTTQHIYNHPTAIVIFGGTGNLAQTKLLPALFNLFLQQLLPQTFTIIGLSRKVLTDEAYQAFVYDVLKVKHGADDAALKDFCTHLQYVPGGSGDDNSYGNVKKALHAFDEKIGQCTSKLFYLAVPPDLYGEIFDQLKKSNALAPCGDEPASWSRLLVEKPFGSDLDTAQELEKQLCELFSEEQLYRIDHYLAKDSIENIMSLRFANSILSDSWNGTKIESIAIQLFEAQDVATRGSFYDRIGALRDVGQNHMLQMLALLTMHNPDMHSSESIRSNRFAAVQSLVMHDTDLRVRGQYLGYRETIGVDPVSETETYFKIHTHIDSDLWKNVQVSLESGKALGTSLVDTTIVFRPTETCTCSAEEGPHEHRNVLRMTFSPEHMIRLTMWVREPSFNFKLREQEFILTKQEGEVFKSPEAYERVLYDCIIGDQTRFVSGAEILAAWEFITPILESFKTLPLNTYEPGNLPTHYTQ